MQNGWKKTTSTETKVLYFPKMCPASKNTSKFIDSVILFLISSTACKHKLLVDSDVRFLDFNTKYAECSYALRAFLYDVDNVLLLPE